MNSTIDSETNEVRTFAPPEAFRSAAGLTTSKLEGLYNEAALDLSAFWGRLARQYLAWQEAFTQVLDESQAPSFRWFADGRLNASYNCLDRHLETHGEKTALIFEIDCGRVQRYTYRDVQVCGRLRSGRCHALGKNSRRCASIADKSTLPGETEGDFNFKGPGPNGTSLSRNPH